MQSPFTYELPKEKIAERPVYPYDEAKLLVLNRKDISIKESIFKNLIDHISNNYVLVFNNTKVIPARVFAENISTGGKVELLFLDGNQESEVKVLCKPLKKVKFDTIYKVNSEHSVKFIKKVSEKEVLVKTLKNSNDCSSLELIEACGSMPIPPYMRKGISDETDLKDYQSIFAKSGNSVAAPTASLHFTKPLLAKLKDNNFIFEEITLHVGSSSFLPVMDDDGNIVPPGSEFSEYSKSFYNKLLAYKKEGLKILAVGTTVVRALESLNIYNEQELNDGIHPTNLFIKPEFNFNLVDALITNFHQPGTTHMLLVEAFLGKELLSSSYDYALKNNFRFLSYGDGMLVL